jgi:hypothetical protein
MRTGVFTDEVLTVGGDPTGTVKIQDYSSKADLSLRIFADET